MRHVPGFDQGWRGYEGEDKDAGSSITNVEDDRGGKAGMMEEKRERE